MAHDRKNGNSDKSMTAIECLKTEMEQYGDSEYLIIRWTDLDELINQAKQMEKEQIISAHKEGNKYNGWALRHEHEKYYNETFGKS